METRFSREGENSICEHNHRNPIEEPKHDKLSLMWGEYKEGKVSYI